MFRFELGTRVNVPGSQDKAQGVVTHQAETIPGYPVYSVKWLVADGTAVEGMIGEGDLAVVNPPILPTEPLTSVDVNNALKEIQAREPMVYSFSWADKADAAVAIARADLKARKPARTVRRKRAASRRLKTKKR